MGWTLLCLFLSFAFQSKIGVGQVPPPVTGYLEPHFGGLTYDNAIAHYRVQTERMVASAEAYRRTMEGELARSRAYLTQTEAGILEAKIAFLNETLPQLRQDIAVMRDIQNLASKTVHPILYNVQFLRNTKITGHWTATSKHGFLYLAGVSIDGESYEDIVEKSLIDLRNRKPRFKDIIDENGEIIHLDADNFVYERIDSDVRRAIEKGKMKDWTLDPIKPFEGGTATELCLFTKENHYAYRKGSDAYRILGVTLSAIEVHALKKVDEILGKLNPLRDRILGFWQKFQEPGGTAPGGEAPNLALPPVPGR